MPITHGLISGSTECKGRVTHKRVSAAARAGFSKCDAICAIGEYSRVELALEVHEQRVELLGCAELALRHDLPQTGQVSAERAQTADRATPELLGRVLEYSAQAMGGAL